MFNSLAKPSAVIVDRTSVKETDSYVYLCEKTASDSDQLSEVKRRIVLGWTAFGKVYNFMRIRKSTIETKRKLFSKNVLPMMNYGSEI